MKKGEKNKIINKIIAPILADAGFKLDTLSSDNFFWNYFRKVPGHIFQIISIEDTTFSLNMLFFTTVSRQKKYSAADLIGGSEYEKVAGYPYHSEIEFEDLINKYKKLIVDKGLDFLDELSNTERKPTVSKDKSEKLEQAQKAICECFRNKYTKDNYLELFEGICQKLNTSMLKEYYDCENELMGVTAEYGEWLIATYGGEWCWNQDSFEIRNCGKASQINPLKTVFELYNNKYAVFYMEFFEQQKRELL